MGWKGLYIFYSIPTTLYSNRIPLLKADSTEVERIYNWIRGLKNIGSIPYFHLYQIAWIFPKQSKIEKTSTPSFILMAFWMKILQKQNRQQWSKFYARVEKISLSSVIQKDGQHFSAHFWQLPWGFFCGCYFMLSQSEVTFHSSTYLYYVGFGLSERKKMVWWISQYFFIHSNVLFAEIFQNQIPRQWRKPYRGVERKYPFFPFVVSMIPRFNTSLLSWKETDILERCYKLSYFNLHFHPNIFYRYRLNHTVYQRFKLPCEIEIEYLSKNDRIPNITCTKINNFNADSRVWCIEWLIISYWGRNFPMIIAKHCTINLFPVYCWVF